MGRPPQPNSATLLAFDKDKSRKWLMAGIVGNCGRTIGVSDFEEHSSVAAMSMAWGEVCSSRKAAL